MPTILIIDDNETIRDGLAHTVKKLGHEAITATGGIAGIEAFKAKRPDFVISDLKMEGPSGVDVLRALTALDPDVPIMIITGFGTVETAVEAMKLGAFDFITKPFWVADLRDVIEKAVAASRLVAEPSELGGAAPARDAIIGQSRVMQTVYKDIGRYATASVTVLVCVEPARARNSSPGLCTGIASDPVCLLP